MIDLYRRVVSLELRVGATVMVVSGARVAFDVKRDDSTHANLADIKIYNLAETTRAQIKRGAILDLSAGFVDVSGSIFRGAVYEVQPAIPSGGDVITSIKASDAAGSGSISLAYKGSTSWATVAMAACRAVSGACGVGIGNAASVISTAIAPAYPRGYSCRGRAMSELARVLAVGGLSVSVQSGDLVVLREASAVGVGQVVSLTANSGLVGYPTVAGRKPPGSPPDKSPKGHTIKALLQPRIYPGSMVSVESVTLTGQYRVKSVGHSGDSEGSEWFSSIEVYP